MPDAVLQSSRALRRIDTTSAPRHSGRRLWLIAALALLTGCAGGTGQYLSIPDQPVLGARVPSGRLSAVLLTPDGPGPFPVVILLHGCSGVRPIQSQWADRLRSWGYAALILDSFSARGGVNVCADANQPLVTPRDRAADALSAALYLRTLPKIDGTRVAVLGDSHGGSTAVWVTRVEYERLYPGLLAASVDYYGACGNAADHGSVPLLVLSGEADDWVPPSNCLAFGKQLKPNQPFEIHIYPGAVHMFDATNVNALTINEGHKMRYDYTAASDSFEHVRTFLDHWVRGKLASE
jgi:dienelactone hydrolase